MVDGKKVVVEMGPDAKNTIAELDKKITALAEKVEHLVEELGQQDEQDERNERGLGRAWTA